jgi:malonate transporter
VATRIKDLLATPIIAASILGLVLTSLGAGLPEQIRDPLDLLANLAIPTVLLAFGISLSTQSVRPERRYRLDVILAVVLKVVLMPASAYALARWGFGIDGKQLAVVAVLAALPAGQNINTYATVYGCGEPLARDGTLITTAASIPVILAIAGLIGV